MIKNPITIFVFLLLSAGFTTAQQLSPSVVSSSGGFYSNGSGMLSFTTGEMSAVETFTSLANILTQGFQQPSDIGTYVIDHPGITFSFGVYPNPSDGNINLVTESRDQVDLIVRVANLLGRTLMQEDIHHQGELEVHPLDLVHAPAGIYLLTLAIKTNDFIETEQTIKIEIIR